MTHQAMEFVSSARPHVVADATYGISPIDLEPLDVPKPATPEAVDAAVQRVRRAQQSWSRRTLKDRTKVLRAAAKDMLVRRSEVIELARREIGKVEAEGIFNEALGPLDTLKGWTSVLEGALVRETFHLNPMSFPGKRAYVDRVARGVVGIIAPWNYPVAGLYRSVFPALLCGNGVVLKPSPYSPRTSAWLAEVLADHLPNDLIAVVHGDGAVGEALIDAGIDACVFTGSTTTGRKVQVHCAERGIPSSVEMGGNDPAIVLADCDMERTVAGITHWALSNAGQACGAIELVYVDEQIADELVERLRRAWGKLRAGPGLGADTDVPPLANRRQLEVVQAHVQDAKEHGATVVCGGEALDAGLWYAPTILDHCDERMAVVREETFGPVLPIVRVEGVADAVRAANLAPYGLGASIWSRDIERAERLAQQLDVGVVTINNHSFSGAIASLPWSGTRATGFGVANSQHSLHTYVRPQTTVVDSWRLPELFWMPYDKTLSQLGNILADAQIGRPAEAWKLPMLMAKRVQTVRAFFKAPKEQINRALRRSAPPPVSPSP